MMYTPQEHFLVMYTENLQADGATFIQTIETHVGLNHDKDMMRKMNAANGGLVLNARGHYGWGGQLAHPETVNTDEKQKKNNFVNFKADSI